MLIQAKENGAVLHTVNHLQVAVAAQTGQILWTGVQHQVHLTRQQSGNTGGLGLDGAVHNFRHIARSVFPTPPVGVAHQCQTHIRLPTLHHIRATAHGIAVCKTLVFGADVFGLGRFVLFRPCLAHDAKLGQLIQQHRIGASKHHVHRGVIDLDHLVDALGIHRVIRRFGLGAHQRKHHVISGQCRPITELHSRTQGKTRLSWRHLSPRRGQLGFDLECAAVVIHQRLIHCGMHTVAQRVVLRMDVQRRNIAGTGPFERFGMQSTCAQHQGSGQNGELGFHCLTPQRNAEVRTMQHACRPPHRGNP